MGKHKTSCCNSHTGVQLLLPKRTNNGKRDLFSTSKVDEKEGFQCLGHSNWTICIPLNPFCYRNFPTFSPSYWEANSYYPRGLIMEKGNSHNSKSERDSGFSMLRAFILDYLHHFKPIFPKEFSNFSTFILGGQFLLPQRANNRKWVFFQPQKLMRQRVLHARAIQSAPFESL